MFQLAILQNNKPENKKKNVLLKKKNFKASQTEQSQTNGFLKFSGNQQPRSEK